MTDDTQKQVAETVARLRGAPLYDGGGECSDATDEAADLLEALVARMAEVEAERDDALAFLDNAVSDAPEPLTALGSWLANMLDEDKWPAAERYLNAAVKSLADTLRYCENQMQDADHVTHAKMLQERARAEAAEARVTELEALLAAYQDQTVPDLTAVYLAGGMDRRDEVVRLRAEVERLKAGVTAHAAAVIAVENAINTPWPGAGPDEPIGVQDYRHWLYRIWSPLSRALAAPRPTATKETKDE